MNQKNDSTKLSDSSSKQCVTLTNNIYLMELFSNDFLNNLKKQLTQKTKPSKSVLQALKHSSTSNNSYRIEIAELQKKVNKLTLQNSNLQLIINNLSANTSKNEKLNDPKISKSKTQNLIVDYQTISIVQQKSHIELEIEMLKSKISYLQQYRNMKEQRFNQMIERQAKYVGEINMLKYKNQKLQNKIIELEQKLRITESQKYQAAKNSRKTHQNQIDKCQSPNQINDSFSNLQSYVNQQDNIHETSSAVEINHQLIMKQQNSRRNLVVSCTQQIAISKEILDDSMHNHQNVHREFEQIDNLLAEQLNCLSQNQVTLNRQLDLTEGHSKEKVLLNNSTIFIEI